MPAAPRTLRLYYFTSFAALGVYLPLFPPWLEARGVRGLAMGVVAATLPAMGIVGPPAFGAVADALALRGSLLRIACGGAFAAFGAIAVAAMAGRPLGLAGLLVAASVFAFFRSPMVQLADVVALELERDRAVSYGRLRLFGSLGFLVAAAAAGRWLDLRAPAGLPAVVALLLLGALGSAWLLPAGRGGAPRVPALSGELRRLLAAADVRLFLATAFLSQIAHSAYDLCFSLRLYDLGAPGALVGAAWALGVVAEVGLMAFATPLCARVRPARLVAFGVAGAALRWLLVARVEDPSILLALQPLHALSFAAVWIGFLAWTRARVPGHLLGTVQGVFSASTAAGSVVGMLAWGPLYRRGGGAATFGAAAAVAAVALLVAVRWAGSAEAEPAAKGAPAAAK